MSEHYYSKDPKVKSQPKELVATIRQKQFQFHTDAGVFSKGDVDFGSKLLAETFDMPVVDGDVLDVGCGYGPIGLSIASSFPNRTIHMIDVNERALSLCTKNAERNGITNTEIYSSDAFSDVQASEFAAILTNPPIRAGKKTVFSFYDGAFSKLCSGGELWVVIQKKQGAPSTIEHLEQLFGNAEIEIKKKGYYIIKAVKV